VVKSLKNASHVAQGKNINNVVVNSQQTLVNKSFARVLMLSNIQKRALDMI